MLGDWITNKKFPGSAPGGQLAGGPPRAVHHITDDKLNADGTRSTTIEDVARYLVDKNYEPHLIVDPLVPGSLFQFISFSRSAYALEHNQPPETNRMGNACIQIEWFFTPGTVFMGKRYDTLADTLMCNLDLVLEACDSYAIPRVWPLGLPAWSGTSRDARVWTAQAGHYGHCHVPGNDHTDPGPIDATKWMRNPEAMANLSKEDADLIADRIYEKYLRRMAQFIVYRHDNAAFDDAHLNPNKQKG